MSRPPYVPPRVAPARFPAALVDAQERPAIGPADWDAVPRASAPPRFDLDLGGVRVRIAAEPGDRAAGALGEAFAPFAGPLADDPDLVLGLAARDGLARSAPVARVASASREGELLARFRGVAVRFDPDRRLAWAACGTERPEQELANLVRLVLAVAAPRAGAFLVHAAAVAIGGRAALACGPAHSGKSTAARLARPRTVLTDDALLVRVADGRAWADAVGLWGAEGSEGLARERRRARLEVAALLMLERARATRLSRLHGATAALRATCVVQALAADAWARRAALPFAAALAAAVPVHELAFSDRDAGCWDVVEAALAGG